MSKLRTRYWAVVRTKQANSRDAVVHVARQGFEYYRGLYRERPVLGVRRVKPLFPFYLLIKINLRDDAWKCLHSTKGITSVFMNGDQPSRVPDEHVEYFRACENDMGYHEDAMHEAPRFNAGDDVRGASGWFKDHLGTYVGLAGDGPSRVNVLFTLLGKPHTMSMSAYDLAAA